MSHGSLGDKLTEAQKVWDADDGGDRRFVLESSLARESCSELKLGSMARATGIEVAGLEGV